MTLKDIKKQGSIFKDENRKGCYHLIDKGMGMVTIPYLCSIEKVKTGFTIIGDPEKKVYFDAAELMEAARKYASSLPYPAEFYNPMLRKGLFSELCVTHSLKSMGFKSLGDKVYQIADADLYNLGKEKWSVIVAGLGCVKHNKEVTIIFYKGKNYQWFDVKVKNDPDLILQEIKSFFHPYFAYQAAKNLELIKNFGEFKGIGFEKKQVDTSGMGIETVEFKTELKDILQKIIDKL